MTSSTDRVETVAGAAPQQKLSPARGRVVAGPVAGYFEIIRRAIRRTWRQAPEATVDDIAQDACLKVVQALERGPQPDKLEAFLYRVGANAALDALRKVGRLRETQMVEQSSADQQPDKLAAQAALFDQVEAALNQLAPHRQTAVRLYLLGYRPADTKALTGWSVHRIRNLVYRGLRDLRRALARQGIKNDLE